MDTFKAPNLDAASEEDLKTLERVLAGLYDYARHKREAKRYRRAGDAKWAKLEEGICETVLEGLPFWARW